MAALKDEITSLQKRKKRPPWAQMGGRYKKRRRGGLKKINVKQIGERLTGKMGGGETRRSNQNKQSGQKT